MPFYCLSTPAALAGFQRSVIYSRSIRVIISVLQWSHCCHCCCSCIHICCHKKVAYNLWGMRVAAKCWYCCKAGGGHRRGPNQLQSFSVRARAHLTPFRTTSAYVINVIIIMLDNGTVKTVNHNTWQFCGILVFLVIFIFFSFIAFLCLVMALFSIKQKFNALFCTHLSGRRVRSEELKKKIKKFYIKSIQK